MTELGRPPIDPMSDLQWARVERGLWQRLDGDEASARPPKRPRRTPLWIAVSAAAMVAVVLAIVLLTSGDHAPTTLTPPPHGSELARVTTGAAPSSATFGDVYIELDARSSMRADADRAELEHGGAEFTVAPRGLRSGFVVEAGDARVRVIGTQFRVTREDDRISASVTRGTVEITFRGRVVQVVAGHSWRSDAPTIITEVVPLSPPSPVTPTPTPAPTPTPIPTPMPNTPTPVPAPRRPPPIDDAAEYRRMAALEPSHPDAAITGYLAIAMRSSTWAEPSRWAAARLAFEHGDPRAERLLSEYLTRYPHGQNAIDARLRLDRLHKRP